VWLPTDLIWPPDKDDIPAAVMRLIEDPDWCMQTKEDGVHLLAARTPTRQVFLNRKGEPHAVPAATAKALEGLLANTLLDGEKLHEGGLVLFDCIYENDRDLREWPYRDRLDVILSEILTRVDQSVIRVVRTEFTAEAKLAFLIEAKAQNLEGIILKNLRAKYVPGRPDEGAWTMHRLKYRKSLTCICQRRPTTDKNQKASFEMFVLDGNGKPVNIGQVTAQQYFGDIEPGKARIGEVSYLYSSPSNKLVQPVLVRPMPWRTDKTAEECTLDQLVRGGRFAVK
jgi:bifunctional non-homologous end joining protein LigD